MSKSDSNTASSLEDSQSRTSSNYPDQHTAISRRSIMKIAGASGVAGLIGSQSSTVAAEEGSDEFDPIEASVSDVIISITEGDETAHSVTKKYLERIEEYDDVLNTIITLNPDALDRADELDDELADSGPVGPLHGVPIILKDNLDTADMPTSAGSKILEDSVPPEDAFIVKQLREAGAIVLGKSNMDEWAHGGAPGGGYSSLGGQTLNPYNTDRGPAGSSGGSGAAPAANLGVLAIGTDTGGSVRGPVAANGLVGIKPTLGLPSRTGIIPFSTNLDVPGPMTKSVSDAAIVLGVIAGVDPDDPKTYQGIGKTREDYTKYLNQDELAGARIGFSHDFLGGNPEIDEKIETAVSDMQQSGATIIDSVEFPTEMLESIGDIYFPIVETELKHYLGEYFESLGDDAPVESLEDVIEISSESDFPIDNSVLERLESAQDRGPLTDNDYLQTLESGRGMLQRIVDQIMEENQLDALVAPTSDCPAEPIDPDSDTTCESTPFRTAIANITGYPEVSVPAGFTSDGLPVSVSFFGRPFSEPQLLKLAYSYEQKTEHRAPPEEFGSL